MHIAHILGALCTKLGETLVHNRQSPKSKTSRDNGHEMLWDHNCTTDISANLFFVTKEVKTYFWPIKKASMLCFIL